MNSLEFGIGYINGGAHKPIHSSYAAQRVVLGLSQVRNMMSSDSPEARAFASYWLDNISFKLQKEAQIKKVMGK